jgi:glycosyltransferase involved in cell wall biosynthesis
VGAEPPPPFEREADFIAWLNEPVAAGLRPRVSRYLYSVYRDRPDLQAAFPRLEGEEDCSKYFMWAHGDGILQEGIPRPLRPRPFETVRSGRSTFASPSALQEGVNIAGHFSAGLGIGEAARLLRGAMTSAGIPHSTLDYHDTASRKIHPFDPSGDGRAPYDVNVVCLNADRISKFANYVGPEFFTGRHTVGYWFWELEQFPPFMHAGFDVVDEVWAASRFVADAIGRIGRRPTHHVPLALPVPRCASHVTRDSLGLPGGFLFLFVFDFFSIIERKNPLGLVEAFGRAFRPGEGPTLLIKTINGHRCRLELERLRAAVDRPDVLVIDEYYTAEQKDSLLGLCDCYVSLHRSEGLGLTMAEAMALGRPVIATAYSGNLDFMTAENSYLVDYVSGRVPPGSGDYPAGSGWAEPKIDHAAELMRRVYGSRAEADARAARAREDIVTKHSVRASAAAVTRRLDAIRGVRSRVFIGAAENGGTAGVVPAPTPLPLARSGLPFGKRLLFRGVRLSSRLRHASALIFSLLRDAPTRAARAAAREAQERQALEAVWEAVRALEAKQLQQQSELDAISATAQEGYGPARRRG